jgi:spore germination protein (amino acid permease)
MIKDGSKISPFLVFYIIHTSQVGVGVLGFQRIIMKSIGYDAWISVLVTGLFLHLHIWMLYYMLKCCNGDLTDIHKQVFGKWVGKFFSFIWILYFLLSAITVLRTYIEIIEVWMFPRISVWMFTAVVCLLLYYLVTGGFRTVVGICFFGVIIPLPLVILIIFPLEFANFGNLLPVLRVPIQDIVFSMKDMTLSFLGLELLLIYYPFIKESESSAKWAHLGLGFTTLLYILITVITFTFYSEGQLQRTIWATLSLFKIVQLPFIERFEYIGISLWALVIFPNLALYSWAISRIAKRVFSVSQRKFLILTLVLIFIFVVITTGREQVNMLNDYTSKAGLILLGAYIPILFILFWLKKLFSNSKGREVS